jgi:hypothetical protein
VFQVRKTSAQGTRLNEAKFINKSLSALGNVINALTSTSPSNLAITQQSAETPTGVTPLSTKHIPYRDSKLTRLLQDSLSGNSKTILFLTVSLAIEHLPETLSTLRFGERARKLRTKPRINIELNDLNSYKQNYIKLEKQFLSLKGTIDELRKELIEKDQMIEEMRAREMNSMATESPLKSCSNCLKLNELIQHLKMSMSSTESLTLVTDSSSFSSYAQSPSRIPIKSSPKLSHSPIQEMPLPPVSDETRCAICGLNELETEQLREDTGESLGGYFTCDGNCGNIFHVRCGGEIGEGGQYTVPSGEWYCTTCSVADDELEIVKNLKIVPNGQMASLCALSSSTESNKLQTAVSHSSELHEDNSDQSNSQQNLRILSEYHKIRRERNRILNQWQHEQRLLKQRNDLRDAKEFELTQELITAKEIINKLQDDVCRSHRSQKSVEKRLSEAVQELLMMKNEKMKAEYAKQQPPQPQQQPQQEQQQVNDSPPKNLLSPSLAFQGTSKESMNPLKNVMTQPILPSNKLCPALIPPAAEIPKPWLKKSSLKKANSINTSDHHKLDSLASTLPSSSPPVTSELPSSQSKRKQRLPTSPIRQSSLSNPSSSTGVVSLDTPSFLILENATAAAADHFSSSSSLSSKSPFNKRLINLIQIVKEETGSFAEIRKKYKERETERSMLKSRHHAFPRTSEEQAFGETFSSEDT